MPGGTAVLPSSALMLSVPAGIAGCKTIVLATPPRSDGTITPEVLWCAKRAGVTHILKAGGAQAVAAMAWGTETCPKVYLLLAAFCCVLMHGRTCNAVFVCEHTRQHTTTMLLLCHQGMRHPATACKSWLHLDAKSGQSCGIKSASIKCVQAL